MLSIWFAILIANVIDRLSGQVQKPLMKIHLQTWLALAMLLVAFSPISEAASSGSPATNWAVQQFHEVDTLLVNPDQGWMSQSGT